MWVDAQFQKYKSMGMAVENPLMITNCKYEYILIAIDSPEVCRNVYAFLQGKNVSKEKIWSPFGGYSKLEQKITEKAKSLGCKGFLNNKPDIKHLSIAFIILNPIKGGGGHRNYSGLLDICVIQGIRWMFTILME